jgi:hypothetical protein
VEVKQITKSTLCCNMGDLTNEINTGTKKNSNQEVTFSALPL